MAFDKAKEYKPGEKCEASWIYNVTHDKSHHQAHEVTVVFNEPFPPCNGCGPVFPMNFAMLHTFPSVLRCSSSRVSNPSHDPSHHASRS